MAKMAAIIIYLILHRSSHISGIGVLIFGGKWPSFPPYHFINLYIITMEGLTIITLRYFVQIRDKFYMHLVVYM